MERKYIEILNLGLSVVNAPQPKTTNKSNKFGFMDWAHCNHIDHTPWGNSGDISLRKTIRNFLWELGCVRHFEGGFKKADICHGLGAIEK